ncbi:MAG: glycosyltransferase family 4 protein [Candidatus Paceibacterota bacterium]|jgi:glycosyltransferase involved in cell wall biosynthesis
MTKKRILIFSLAYYPKFVGGAEVAIKEITDRCGDDFEFDMITLRLDKALPKVEKIGNVTVYRIGFAKHNPKAEELLRFPMYLAKVFFPVAAAIKSIVLHHDKKYDALWSMMTYMGFPAVLFKFFHPKVPFVLTIQDGDSIEHITGRRRIRVVGLLFREIFKKANAVQAISHFLAEYAKDMGATCPVVVVPNAVDVDRFAKEYSKEEIDTIKEKLQKKEGDITLITTSRLVPKNAVEDVIAAMPLLPSNVHFLIAGTGPLETTLCTQAKMLGVEERVRFLSFVSQEELPKYLKASDIFIRTPLSEGFGISFVEAMASGIPVVTTPVGGIPDFLKDKETGLFAKVRDHESIANAVMELVRNPALVSSVKRQAFDMVVSKYDWKIVGEEMRRIFHGL